MTAAMVWSPSRAVFLRRALINAALTFPAFVLLARFTNYPQGQFLLLGVGLPLVLTLIFFMDDALRWRRVRDEQWELADGQLIHEGPEGLATISLGEIEDVFKRFGGTVIIAFTSRQRVAMRYLPEPDDVVMTLHAAAHPD